MLCFLHRSRMTTPSASACRAIPMLLGKTFLHPASKFKDNKKTSYLLATRLRSGHAFLATNTDIPVEAFPVRTRKTRLAQ